MSKLLTVEQVTDILGCCQNTLREITSPRGDLPAVRVRRRVMYRPEAVDAWLRKQEVVG